MQSLLIAGNFEFFFPLSDNAEPNPEFLLLSTRRLKPLRLTADRTQWHPYTLIGIEEEIDTVWWQQSRTEWKLLGIANSIILKQ